MNLNNFTIKAQEVVQAAQQAAFNSKNPQIENHHLLAALVSKSEDTIEYIVKKNNGNLTAIETKLQKLLADLPTTTQDGGQALSRDLNTTVLKAQSLLKNFKDEFVSVEHLLLALVSNKDVIGNLLRAEGLIEKNVKAAILDLRKGSNVNSQNADAQYNALLKYAKNLNN